MNTIVDGADGMYIIPEKWIVLNEGDGIASFKSYQETKGSTGQLGKK